MNVQEFASYCIFHAHSQLKQVDLALQAGERHLKQFADGQYYAGVEIAMNGLIATVACE